MAKVYTAQDMRDEANSFDRRGYYPSHEAVAMLRQAADALEREEKREKKYEYRIKITTSATEYGFLTLESAKKFKQHHKLDEPIFRREIGEWEEVKE